MGKGSKSREKARFEAWKRVKREKKRGREVSELVRLGMKKRGVDADTDTDSMRDGGERGGEEEEEEGETGVEEYRPVGVGDDAEEGKDNDC